MPREGPVAQNCLDRCAVCATRFAYFLRGALAVWYFGIVAIAQDGGVPAWDAAVSRLVFAPRTPPDGTARGRRQDLA
ncbi:hypothetical protein HMPREF7215_2303 [Pyramidobacter piscolens W5455]|uniref:Uncharacterized protein n=1 Tax=Pyramidobacter piscolens W5455 TaxID=352165 RepID=A0ABM9ZXF4_9BACT|nr:hypothetical protein HMPREF7215_2303 [Pyramidobacter piscolens W5455]